MIARLDRLALTGFGSGECGHTDAQLLFVDSQATDLLGRPRRGRRERHVIGGDERQRELAALLLQGFVLLRLSGLTLERAELAPHLVHDVAHANEILPGRLELALGLGALLLVPRDARGFLDEQPPLVRLRRQDVVQLVLIHDGVRARIGTGAGKQVEDVAQPAAGLVQEIFALARPVETAHHGDLAERDRELVVHERQLDFGQTDGLARRRAVEDQVLHPVAPQ